MRKTTIILLLIVQIILVFIFQNLYSLFKGMEEVDLRRVMDPVALEKRFSDLKDLFSGLSITFGLMILGTGFYVVILMKRSRNQPVVDNMPPLHDFLVELKGSENQLKDIVEQQKIDVTQKQELNKTIVNSINAGVIFIDQTGRIGIFNPEASNMFGQSYANAQNNRLDLILKKFPEIVAFVEENKDEKVSGEIKSNGKLFHIDINPLENIGLLLIGKDVTEEKKREEIHNRNQNFVMLGEMAAFLAHEVKNSLGVIYGYTRTFKSEEDKEKTGKVNKEVQHLTGMMESFLNFSKPVKIGELDELDPAKLLEEIAAEQDLKLELNITNNSEIENEPAALETDAHLLRSAFSNLLLNAKESGADCIAVDIVQNAGLYIRITDNGKGIDDENMEKIWFPFFTTKDKGTGMGLAIIRKILSSLDGEINLEKTGTQGTTFKITFLSP